MLASCSSYFQAMFSSGYKESQWRPDKQQEIFLPGIGAEALAQVLEFVYTGSLELSPTNIQAVLACASQLQVRVPLPLVATQALLVCHKDTAKGTLSPLLGAFLVFRCVFLCLPIYHSVYLEPLK